MKFGFSFNERAKNSKIISIVCWNIWYCSWNFKNNSEVSLSVNFKSEIFQKKRFLLYLKIVCKSVHWGNHGGYRQGNFKVGTELFLEIEELLAMLCWKEPTLTLQDYRTWIDIIFGVQVSKSWISDFIITWATQKKKFFYYLKKGISCSNQ